MLTETETITARTPVAGAASALPTTAPGIAGVRRTGAIDAVLFLCPAYDVRFPSETMWQRLQALTQLAKVAVLPLMPPPDGVIPPPSGAFLAPPPAVSRTAGVLGYSRRVWRQARSLTAQGKRCLVWTNANWFTRRPAQAVARRLGWPLVTDVWDVPDLAVWTHRREGRYLKSLAQRCMLAGLRRHLEQSDLVVWTLHPASLARYFPADSARTLCLPNGIRWQALEEYRRQATAASRPRRLLYMGHFRASRGSTLLVEALERVARSRPFVFDVVGDTATGVARAAIRSLSPELRSRTQLHGRLAWESAMRVLQQADIGLYPFPPTPELEYIYPLKLLEYAGLGKWIVSSDLAGARHQLRHYRKVRFCDPASPAAWAEAIEGLLDMTPGQFQAPGESGLIAAYDWERVNATLLDRVGELLNRKAGDR